MRKKWDSKKTEELRQEYKKMQNLAERYLAKAKQKAIDGLYKRLDTKEAEKDLYHAEAERSIWERVQQVRVI